MSLIEPLATLLIHDLGQEWVLNSQLTHKKTFFAVVGRTACHIRALFVV